MLLTLTNTRAPADDLGYLLHKHPGKVQAFDLPFGQARVFYPELGADRCTAAILLDVDPVGLVRKRPGSSGEGFALEQYVNDRPYVASSFLSVAIARVFGSALAGRCKERPDLVDARLPLEASLAVLPCRGGETFLRQLFEPLGYGVSAVHHPLDERFPDWGEGPYFTVRIRGDVRLQDLLAHLYVLVPVLDDEKHYWVGEDEVEKLLKHGAGWLKDHPARERIVERYLKHRRSLALDALRRLADEDQPDPDEAASAHATEEETLEAPVRLNDQRLDAVLSALRACGARRILDLGCGEGKLVRRLLEDRSVEEVAALDVSHRALEIAADRLRLDRQPSRQRDRVRLLHGSLMYRDKRLAGYDAAAVVEVVEHLDPPRLAAFERVLFEHARPGTVVLTTPNAEYNVRFATLPAGRFRHKDHRFEWTRTEFKAWADAVSRRFGYTVRHAPIGPEDPAVGPPSQMAVFTR